MVGKKTLFKFFEISSTPSLVLCPDTPKFTIVEVNNAYLDATNSKRNDLIGKGIFEAFPDNDADPTADGKKNLTASLLTVIKTLKNHKMGIQKYDIPIRGTSKFELKYWEPENIPLLDDDGKLEFIIHTVLDVTEKVTAKKEIREFEYFFTNSNDFFGIANTEGYFEIINPSFKNVLGYSKNELATKPFIDFVHPDDVDSTLKAYAKVKSGAALIHFINRYRKKNGEYIWLEWNATPNPVTGKLHCIARDVTDRKKAEDELNKLNGELEQRVKERTKEVEKALQRFEYVTKATFDAIWDWNLQDDTIFWGDGFEKIFGYKLSDLKDSKAWIENIHPEDIQKITESYYNIVKSKQNSWIEEYRYKKRNGQYSYVINKGIVIRDEEGRAIRIIGAMQDITKRKEEELRLKLLESVVTNTNDAVVIKEAIPSDEQGRKIVYVNESFTRMSGYSAEEIIGKTHKLVQGANTDAEELKRFYKALDAWQPVEITIVNYNKKGEEYWVELSLNPVTNALGEYTHWISIERDVTEKKHQEQKIKETTQRLHDTLESIQDGFYTLDSNWNVSYWNKEAERLSGQKYEDMIGKNFWELYEGQISEKIHDAFYKAKFQKKPVRLEIYSKIVNGWFELNAFPSEMGLTVYFKNITERKHTESKLKKMNRELENHVKELAISNEELEQFAYVASHDLQEPLRMVTSFLTQIEKKYENILDEKGKQYIFFAVDGAKRMRQIILDLLEFSRVGKNETKFEEIDVNTIIEEVKFLYRKQIEDKNAEIRFESLPTIKTHVAPIKQVFQNLISNGLKYSKPGIPPIITISCHETPANWKFEIKDNGIGIGEEYFEKIFVIFQRLHSRQEYSGTGMGLSITKKIIENLKGQIYLESKVNQGTTFYFTIPKK